LEELNIKNLFKCKQSFGLLIFFIGLFLLPSAFSISVIFILISLIISTFKFKDNYLDDVWNLPFLLSGVLLILSSLIHTFSHNHLPNYDLNPSLTWVGLGNWLPFFWCFWGFQTYLDSPEKRRICGLILIAGSFPVIISGLGQSFLNWDGPFQTLFGLITWYQRPIDNIFGLTGLFNNPNYAGSWLNSIWPFCLACLIDLKNKTQNKISTFFFTFGISLTTILTNSRSAWIGILMGSFLMYGKKSLKYLKYLFLIFIFILISTKFVLFGNNFQNFLKLIIPESIWLEFSDFQYTRLEIWRSAILYVINSPLFGYGAGSFPEIFKLETGLWKGHAHNLPLELMVSYGVPAGLLIIIPIVLLLILGIKKLFKKNLLKKELIFDKAWIVSLFVLISSQMVDVQYFDGRISILVWILLSGTKNIITDNSIKYQQN
jgi:O-antigen ligase